MVIERTDNEIIIRLAKDVDLKEIELMLNNLGFHADKIEVASTNGSEPKAEKKRLRFEDFNFLKSQEMLKDVKGTLSDAVIEERRSYL